MFNISNVGLAVPESIRIASNIGGPLMNRMNTIVNHILHTRMHTEKWIQLKYYCTNMSSNNKWKGEKQLMPILYSTKWCIWLLHFGPDPGHYRLGAYIDTIRLLVNWSKCIYVRVSEWVNAAVICIVIHRHCEQQMVNVNNTPISAERDQVATDQQHRTSRQFISVESILLQSHCHQRYVQDVQIGHFNRLWHDWIRPIWIRHRVEHDTTHTFWTQWWKMWDKLCSFEWQEMKAQQQKKMKVIQFCFVVKFFN